MKSKSSFCRRRLLLLQCLSLQLHCGRWFISHGQIGQIDKAAGRNCNKNSCSGKNKIRSIGTQQNSMLLLEHGMTFAGFVLFFLVVLFFSIGVWIVGIDMTEDLNFDGFVSHDYRPPNVKLSCGAQRRQLHAVG